MATKLLVIVGPTGVGKSVLAMRLAREFDGEIIGADSRQVYRHMSIGTAKPSDADRAEIPHHLVDSIEPDERYSLALFLRDAKQSIHNAKKLRGRLPLVVGGTGQYVWGLLEGWQVPEVNPNAKLRETLELSGWNPRAWRHFSRSFGGWILRQWSAIDGRNPSAGRFGRWRLHFRSTRTTPHSRGDDDERPRKIPPDYDAMVVGLTMERSALYKRIDARIDAQMAAGWLDEVRGLRELGYGLEHAALSGLGYGELMRHLDGEMTLDDAVQRIKYRTHRYARQQYNVVPAGR